MYSCIRDSVYDFERTDVVLITWVKGIVLCSACSTDHPLHRSGIICWLDLTIYTVQAFPSLQAPLLPLHPSRTSMHHPSVYSGQLTIYLSLVSLMATPWSTQQLQLTPPVRLRWQGNRIMLYWVAWCPLHNIQCWSAWELCMEMGNGATVDNLWLCLQVSVACESLTHGRYKRYLYVSIHTCTYV